MKPGDLVRLKSGSKHTPYSHGVILEITEGSSRYHERMARVLWQNGIQNELILRDFVHYYEVVNGG